MNINVLRARADQARENPAASQRTAEAKKIAADTFSLLQLALQAQLGAIADRGDTNGTFSIPLPKGAFPLPQSPFLAVPLPPRAGVGAALAEMLNDELAKMGVSGAATYKELAPEINVSVDFT